MSHFTYSNGQLCAEQVPLSQIAEQFGTPCYIYSRAALESQWQQLDSAFGTHPHTICYAVKANSNLAVLSVLAKLGSGFDIVSEGELRRVLLAGGDPKKVVFSGVAKSHQEIEFALSNKIRSINVESVAELKRVQEIAQRMNTKAPIALRVNPDVDPKTHPYISTGMEKAKFGITMESAFKAYQLADDMPNIEIHGIACHIGSQITTASPFTDAVDKVMELVLRLKEVGINLKQLDLGGGLGIDYQGETPPSADEWINTLLGSLNRNNIDLPISIEPGRFIAGNSGILITRVEYLKSNSSKNFAIVDAGMNDLLRPSLYQAYHQIDNVNEAQTEPLNTYDVVGPICESSDVLGHDRKLNVAANDLLAIRSTGAYSFTMASNYNSKPRAAEILVDGDKTHVARQRETFEDLTKGEAILP